MEDAQLAAAIEASLAESAAHGSRGRNRGAPDHRRHEAAWTPPDGCCAPPPRGNLVAEFLDLFEEGTDEDAAAAAALAEAGGDVREAATRHFHGTFEHEAPNDSGPRRTAVEPEPEPEPEQLLPAGCAVQVQGLQGAPQHNGKHGRVLRFDAVKGRYQVELASEPPPPPRPSSSSQGQVERVEVAAARTGKGAKGGKGKPVRLLIKAVNLSRVKSGQRIEEAETPSRPDSSESASETASAPEYANEIAIEDIGCTPGYRENLAAQ